jgi:hypothetical protein
MKKTSNFNNNQNEDLLPEYEFDYQKARRNRFAISEKDKEITIVLEPDVAKIFKTSQDVNKALRAIISAMPKTLRK